MGWGIAYQNQGGTGNLSYKGYRIEVAEFRLMIRTGLRARIDYYTGKSEVKDKVLEIRRGLKHTDFDTSCIDAVLSNNVNASDWGEYFSYYHLEMQLGVDLPWPPCWDKRSIRASLQGTDIVGLCINNGIRKFVFGEIKTSSQIKFPPTVMVKNSDGMIDQIRKLEKPDERMRLICWLIMRMSGAEREGEIEEALINYVQDANNYIITGILVRDTHPNEADLKCILTKLKDDGVPKAFYGYYLPLPINESIKECMNGGDLDAGA